VKADTAAEREALLHKNTSILDMVSERAKSLSNDLGPGDKARLSDYLDTVREIERRVAMASSRDLKGIKVPDAPVGELEDFDKQVRLMFDLIALAYQADLTRVASYVMVAEGTQSHLQPRRCAGFVPPGQPPLQRPRAHSSPHRHSALSHGAIRGLPAEAGQHEGRRRQHPRPLAVLLWLEHGQQQPARHYPLPAVLVGGANGAHVGGKNLTLPARTPLANVHLTTLKKLGIEQPSFGNSTGIITEV